MKLLEEVKISTDVLIIGGGIAGLMAAIKARESGASVLLLEKGHARRSGSAATGIDHCWAYLPEIHGPSVSAADIVEDHARYAGGFILKDILYVIASNVHQRVLDLERFGVPMRDEQGRYRLVKKIHRVPSFIHFAGRDMKIRLHRAAHKKGARVLNRAMATDLLINDGEVIGGLAVDTRSLKLYVIKAKAVIMTTGSAFRLYRNPTGLPSNLGFPPSCTGDGLAMALRAGASLINMEFVTVQTGPKNFQRCGRGSYVPGVVRDGYGREMGGRNAIEAVTGGLESARAIGAMDKSVENLNDFRRYLLSGQGPLYMDCTANSPAQNDYIKWALSNEGNQVFLDYLAGEGIDLGREMIEFTYYEPKLSSGNSGLRINTNCETTLPGLYAAGDAIGGVKRAVCPGALTLGWSAGERATVRSKETGPLMNDFLIEEQVKERQGWAAMLLSRGRGATWPEAQLALQNIMDYYCSWVRSEPMLKAGLNHLARLRQRVESELWAANPHELYRSAEVFNLLDVGEAILTAARERRESRFNPGIHYRADFPSTDDEHWRKFLAVRRKGAGLIVEPIEI